MALSAGMWWSYHYPFKDDVGGREEIGERPNAWTIAVVGTDVGGERPYCLGQPNILGTVTNDPRRGQVEVECLGGGSGHAGHRLSVDAGAGEFRH